VRVLIDECAHPRVREAFPAHDVVTVSEAGWRALPDDRIVALAQGNIDVLVTIDRGFEFEHNLRKLDFGIVILHARRNRIEYYLPLFPALLAAIEAIRPGEVIHVG
jgi:predicted nuclease of predicted toxin-antitoxin system